MRHKAGRLSAGTIWAGVHDQTLYNSSRTNPSTPVSGLPDITDTWYCNPGTKEDHFGRGGGTFSLLGLPHTVQSYPMTNLAPQGLSSQAVMKKHRQQQYLWARKPCQLFIDTHEYFMPSKAGLPALPASLKRAAVCIWMHVRPWGRDHWRESPRPQISFWVTSSATWDEIESLHLAWLTRHPFSYV